jgi:uncharacterized membrane protein
MLQDFSNSFAQYFLTQGYNPVNTTVYAFVFVVAAYFIFKILNKLKLKVDRKLAIGIAPFVLMGSIFRVLDDAGILSGFLFFTPGIYFFIFAVTIVALLASLFIQKKFKINYYKIMFLAGLVVDAIALNFLHFVNFYAAFVDIAFYFPWPVFFYLIKWNDANKIVASVQMFDANTTFVSLQFFNYQEQHVVPNIFINLFSPVSFIVVKAAAVIAVLILIDKFAEDKEFANYLKLIIAILGGATSFRDFTRLVAGI